MEPTGQTVYNPKAVWRSNYKSGDLWASGDSIMRAYRSLVAQTYPNWEWVLYDDLLDDHTFVALTASAKTDPRLHVSSKMVQSASSYEGIRRRPNAVSSRPVKSN